MGHNKLWLSQLFYFNQIAFINNNSKHHNCHDGLAFLGADPTTNQRFNDTATCVEEALMDFREQYRNLMYNKDFVVLPPQG
ncbi:hypothetical protein CD138_07245 [Staphylococcus intermedius NCTC 11048]|nr:hypothetical protein CD138_07245 [Staphylococcus intermedius NCTC 11048]